MSFSPGRLGSALEACLSPLDGPAGLCVALSGGLDSTALLAALVERRAAAAPLPPLRAIHVDHGLHQDSARWSEHCARLCASFGVPLENVVVDARPRPGDSPEAAAREARYGALAARLQAGEVLLTAHHADDQLETILLQWLRGGGLRAVAGMPAVAPFASGWHVRPMLAFNRGELHAWARARGLEWLEDPSNTDPRFDRNYLRLEVLPAILRRWPAAAATVGRVAAQATESLEIEAAVAAGDLDAVRDGSTLALARLQQLPGGRRSRALRAWLAGQGVPLPSAATLAALLHDVGAAAPERVPCIDWPGGRVYRYRGRLFAVRGREADLLREGTWTAGTAYDLGGHGQLRLQAATGDGLSRARLPGELAVVGRAEGERFRPAGTAHRRPLRKWFQERGVLPWRRDGVPRVVANGEIVAIGDIAYGGTLAAAPGEPSWRIEWLGRPTLMESEATNAVAGEGTFR